jgi:hypothetical protein
MTSMPPPSRVGAMQASGPYQRVDAAATLINP